MKLIAVSQRVEIVDNYQERRDALDQRWNRFLAACGVLPLLIPNYPDLAGHLLETTGCQGILLTGGNDLLEYGGDSSERDQTENYLMQYAISGQVPLLGVCRGMQVIQNFFGVKLHQVDNHVVVEHLVTTHHLSFEVNSYHRYGTTLSVKDLKITARAEDGVVEAVCHRKYPMCGIMWHPERREPFIDHDVVLFKSFFNI